MPETGSAKAVAPVAPPWPYTTVRSQAAPSPSGSSPCPPHIPGRSRLLLPWLRRQPMP